MSRVISQLCLIALQSTQRDLVLEVGIAMELAVVMGVMDVLLITIELPKQRVCRLGHRNRQTERQKLSP
jgi:hypothetical protein